MRLLLFVLFLVAAARPSRCVAQPYPQALFRNPLRIPILLAGNFGECRPGHFHSGIDIKTGGKENEPVYAAAGGYVSRIKMEPGGFGHALYITHPEGYTTLYAHLNDFTPALQRFTRAAQYAAERWELDTALPPTLFPVRQGEQIAWSGNTGGSTAPHLHFEIRDARTEHPLNPQLFGLPIADRRAPVVKALYLYDLSRSLYGQAPRKIALRKTGDTYIPAGNDTLTAPEVAGLGLALDDYADGSENTLAPYTLAWSAGDAPIGTITLDDIGYDETRYLHAYADYKTKWAGGPWVQCLFRLPGNRLFRIYNLKQGEDGAVWLGGSGAPVPVRIELNDAAGNQSSVRFWLKRSAEPLASCAQQWAPSRPISWSSPNLGIRGQDDALYDSVCASVVAIAGAQEGYMPVVAIGNPAIPLHTALELSITPNRPVPFALRSKLALEVADGKSKTGYATTAEDGNRYRARVRQFGTYRLVPDTVAPRIGALQKIPGGLRFTIADATTSVKSVRGEIDGHWVLFEQHGTSWTYRFDAHCPPGKHTLTLTATDALNNQSKTVVSITR